MDRIQHNMKAQPGLALFTDLYELTTLQAFYEEGMADTAVFSLFVRRLPANRNFLLACGLDTVPMPARKVSRRTSSWRQRGPSLPMAARTHAGKWRKPARCWNKYGPFPAFAYTFASNINACFTMRG